MEQINIKFVPLGNSPNLIGNTYGRWIVLGKSYKRGKANSSTYWWCRCSCQK